MVSALRPYQVEAVDAVYGGWSRGLDAVGVSLPTGTGKTHVMCEIGRREASVPTALPVLYLLHRDQLVEQTVERLRREVPGTSIGIVKAERNEVGARLLVASVHTLRSSRRRAMLPPVRTVIVDEAHVSVSPTYRAVYDHLGVGQPNGPRMVGFSATWQRSDRTGLGDVWQEVVFARTIKWAISQHPPILVRPRGIQVGEGIDLSEMPISRATGDYRDADLGDAVMLEDLRDLVVRAALHYGAGQPGALFAPTVASAEFFAEALNRAGVRTAGIYHDTRPAERRRRLADHAAGRVTVLSTCTALAEGWDAPHTRVGYLLRPTRHEGLFVQITGRFLRPWPGKTDALLLDFVNLLDSHTLRSAIDLRETRAAVAGDDGLTEAAGLLGDDTEDDYEPGDEGGIMVRRRRVSREVELFAGTSVAWQRTPHGVPFVACGDRLVFVVPTGAGWNVGECPTYTTVGGRFLAEGLEPSEALEVAADHAEATGRALSARSAQWRGRRPTEGQKNLALELGIDPAGKTSGELSAAIDMVTATQTLRPMAEWSAAQLSREDVMA